MNIDLVLRNAVKQGSTRLLKDMVRKTRSLHANPGRIWNDRDHGAGWVV